MYFHKKPDGEIFYVGIGSLKRPYTTNGRTKWWHNIANKYGYLVEIIHENLTWGEAVKLEHEYINKLGRADLELGPLVNMTDGGDGAHNRKQNEETRKKISKNNARYNLGKKASKELREKLSRIHIGLQAGEKHPLYGKHHSQEAKDKIGAAHKGMRHSEKTLKQMSDVKLGKIKTEEHRKNLSISLAGKPKSDTHKANMSIAKKGNPLSEVQKLSNKKNGENRIGTKLSLETRDKIANAKRQKNISLGLKVSQYKGVVWDTKRNKWKASVYANGKSNFIGRFYNESDAFEKYNEFIKTV